MFSWWEQGSRVGSVRRGEHFRLHQLHRHAAALNGAVAGLNAEDLGLALLALESLSQLVGHRSGLRLLQLHRLAAAAEVAIARLGNNYLGVALRAHVALAYL